MPLDLPNVSRAINDMFKVEGNAVPTPALIISQVSRFYSIDESILRGTLKNKGTAEARQVAMYLIRQLTNLSSRKSDGNLEEITPPSFTPSARWK